MRTRRAALRLLSRLVEDRPADDADRLLIEAWLWRQVGDDRRLLEALRERHALLEDRRHRLRPVGPVRGHSGVEL